MPVPNTAANSLAFTHGTAAPAQSASRAMQRLEYCLVALLVTIALAFPLLRTENFFSMQQAAGDFTEGSARLQITFGLVFAVSGLLCLKYSRYIWQTLKHINPVLWLFLLWCLATMLWSPYPVVSLKRVVQQIGLLLLGLSLTLPFIDGRYLERILWRALAVILLASLLAVLLIPQMGVDYVRGNAWRGVLWHKNTLGSVGAFAVLTWVNAMGARHVSLRAGTIGLLFACGMLIMAKSSTALFVTAVGVLAWSLARRSYFAGAHLRHIAILGAMVLTCAALLMFYLYASRLPTFAEIISPISAVFSKSPDLTGRTDLWEYVLIEIQQHPWLGIGYGAFWLNVGSPSQYIIDAVRWIPLQAHNGYIDLINETGLIGFGLFIALIGVHIANLLRLTLGNVASAPFHWALLAMIIVSNFSESQLFNGVMFQNALLLLSIVIVGHNMAELRQRASSTGVTR